MVGSTDVIIVSLGRTWPGGEGASCMGTGPVRSSRGEGATTAGPGVMLGAGGGNWYSMVGVAWGATAATLAPPSAEGSVARPPTAAVPQATPSMHAIPSASADRLN